MDKVIREIQGANGVVTYGKKHSPSLPILDQLGGWERGRKGKRKEKRGRELRERSFTFSLNFSAIGPAVSGGARGKIHPRGKSFALRPESGNFDELQEVGVFLLLGLILS